MFSEGVEGDEAQSHVEGGVAGWGFEGVCDKRGVWVCASDGSV